jgi:hypothetical protein
VRDDLYPNKYSILFPLLIFFMTSQAVAQEPVNEVNKRIKVALVQDTQKGEQQFLTIPESARPGAWLFLNGESIKASLGMNRIRSVTDSDKKKVYSLLKDMLQIDFAVFLSPQSDLSLWGTKGQIKETTQVGNDLSRTQLEAFLETQLDFQHAVQNFDQGAHLNAAGKGCTPGQQGVLKKFEVDVKDEMDQSKTVGIIECISSLDGLSKFKLLFPQGTALGKDRLVIDLLPN